MHRTRTPDPIRPTKRGKFFRKLALTRRYRRTAAQTHFTDGFIYGNVLQSEIEDVSKHLVADCKHCIIHTLRTCFLEARK